jgi:hypothetical protein
MIARVNHNQRGVLSRQLVEIAERRAAGTPMTHILNYKISTQPPDNNQTLAIRKALKDAIWEQQIIEEVAAIPQMPNVLYPVPITWRMEGAGQTSAYYYTEAGFFFSDDAIKRHVQSSLSRITTQIRTQHPEYGNEWGLVFVVSRVVGTAILSLAPPVKINAADEEAYGEEE